MNTVENKIILGPTRGFGNMCTCIYYVLYCFVYIYIHIFIYLFLLVTSVRTTATE